MPRDEIIRRQEKHKIDPYSVKGVLQREEQADLYMVTKYLKNADLEKTKGFLVEIEWFTLYSSACYEAVEVIPERFKEEVIRAFVNESSRNWLKEEVKIEIADKLIEKYKNEWRCLPKPDWSKSLGTKPYGNSLIVSAVQNTNTYRRILSDIIQYPWRWRK